MRSRKPAAQPGNETIRSIAVDGQQLRVAVRQGSPGGTPLLLINGIGASLEALDYPAELVCAHVVADNCTDATATIVRAHGVEVLAHAVSAAGVAPGTLVVPVVDICRNPKFWFRRGFPLIAPFTTVAK